jgi:hypothetical protein
MTLPGWPGGHTSVENQIENGGAEVQQQLVESFGAKSLLSSTWSARLAVP